MEYTPAQLEFGRDSILNTHHEANWQLMKKRKQDLINEGNQQDNHNQKKITRATKGTKSCLKMRGRPQDTYQGPYKITAVRNNSTVGACKGRVTCSFSICIITP